jgi:competence protein ComEA
MSNLVNAICSKGNGHQKPAIAGLAHALKRPVAFLTLSAGFSVAAMAQQGQLPEGPGKETLQRVCGACHGAEIVVGRGLTQEGWEQVVGDMVSRGAQGTDEEFAQIVDYLAKNFPPKKGGEKTTEASAAATAKVNINKATAEEIVSGLGFVAQEAQSIVTYRQQNGDFKSIDDVKKVSGIDAAKVDAAKDKIEF